MIHSTKIILIKSELTRVESFYEFFSPSIIVVQYILLYFSKFDEIIKFK